MTERAIASLELDADGDWVAVLVCGHTQHVRHRPPFEVRDWVTTEAGRAGRIGAALDCDFCEMPTLPADAEVYKRTRSFDQDTIPAGLRGRHDTRAGVWGRIVVEAGRLRYATLEPEERGWILRPGVTGVIAPCQPHLVAPVGEVRFHVEFLRRPG